MKETREDKYDEGEGREKKLSKFMRRERTNLQKHQKSASRARGSSLNDADELLDIPKRRLSFVYSDETFY